MTLSIITSVSLGSAGACHSVNVPESEQWLSFSSALVPAPLGVGGNATLEPQNPLLPAAQETEAREVIKLAKVTQPVSHPSTETRILASDCSHSAPGSLSSRGGEEPLWTQPAGPLQKSSSFAGIIVTLPHGKWPGSYRVDAHVSL